MLLPRIPGTGMGRQPGCDARDTGTLCVQYPRMPEEGIRYSGTGITDHGELTCQEWEPNLVQTREPNPCALNC